MAEIDGTPRSRKSKPPKGGSGSGRGTKPLNPKGRRKAELRETLRTGAAVQTPPPAAITSTPKQGGNVVRTSMPTFIHSERSPHPDALADTQQDMRERERRAVTGPAAAPASQTPSKRALRGPLASTLRMDLGVDKRGIGRASQTEPTHDRHRGPEIPRRGIYDTRNTEPEAPHDFAHTGGERGHLQQNESPSAQTPSGQARLRKSTTPGFAPSYLSPSPSPHELGATQRRGSDIAPGTAPSLHSRPPHASNPSSSVNQDDGPGSPPRRTARPRRPGERTLIMRAKTKSSKRDWFFVVVLVAALGMVASMLLSYRTNRAAESVVDATAYEDLPYLDDEPNPFAETTLQPWTGETNETGEARETGDGKPGALAAPALARTPESAVQATELRSEPAGAEVDVGGAVVGSTPVRVARDPVEIKYTLRLPGYQPQTVRVGALSPATIMVKLAPAPVESAADPVQEPTNDAPARP